MSTSKAKLVITVGGNIEVIFTPPYHCVCEAPQSTKRNLQRHIQGCKGRHSCESIEGILRLKLQTTFSSHFKFFGCFLYFFCFLCLFCPLCLLCFFCYPCFIYTHAGSISVHHISFGESTYAGSDAVYFIYDESIGESIYAGSDPVSCVNDRSFGRYGYGVAR
ncbi:hypothetical protein BGX33_012534 [Mortierella sp. NVP41]|nr:hypothetical protein BGX33_012534 [Mortierella sp. NVP41]